MTSPSPSKIVIVTGTSSGIGAGLAETLLDQGWAVLGIARREVKLDSPQYEHLMADLSDLTQLEDQVIPHIATTLQSKNFQRIGLVNNAAAIGALKPLTDIPATTLSDLYAVNVITPARLMGAVTKMVASEAWLKIVNISSGAAHGGLPGLADYAGSKAALRLTGMTLSAEFDSQGRSRASLLSYEPGIVDTEMQLQARNTSTGFPSHEIFENFHSQGVLQPVQTVLREIIAFLESSREPFFTEKRFQPPFQSE